LVLKKERGERRKKRLELSRRKRKKLVCSKKE